MSIKNPGQLNQRWQLQRPVAGEGWAGSVTRSWEPVRTVWLRLRPRSEKEVALGSGQTDTYTHTVIMRYFEGLSSGMRLVRAHRVLDIDTFVDEYNEARYWRVQCTEVL
ncbi:MAG: phage head closure protein [Cellvibrionaceae bacterium]|nr:phage head closure protein [Cellvibrionaceae bacterium]